MEPTPTDPEAPVITLTSRPILAPDLALEVKLVARGDTAIRLLRWFEAVLGDHPELNLASLRELARPHADEDSE